MPASSSNDLDVWIRRAARVIDDMGVVALPYERLFGLAADALDEGAVLRAVGTKGRLQAGENLRPTAVILPAPEAIELVVREVSGVARELMDRYWPGLVTLLLPAREGLPAPLVGPTGLIGVRLPGPSPAATLANRTGKVLTASSANPTGQPDPLRHEDVVAMDGVDLVVPGKVAGPPGSTIVDASGPRPVVLREGAVEIVEWRTP